MPSFVREVFLFVQLVAVLHTAQDVSGLGQSPPARRRGGRRLPGTANRCGPARRADPDTRTRDRESGYSRAAYRSRGKQRVAQQLAGQLADEAADHHDVQDAGGRLGRADAGRLPRHAG